jgi:hypothetical protein
MIQPPRRPVLPALQKKTARGLLSRWKNPLNRRAGGSLVPATMGNLFPRWTNLLPLKIALFLGFVATTVVLGFSYYATPKATRVGYKPDQPVPFSHRLHVGQLGMDCRYCHSQVENANHSNLPSASTCWNCHSQVKPDSPMLAPVKAAIESGRPIEWVQIHETPDYVFFNHAAHVNSGISCVACHGRVDQMEVVWHAEPHSMSWCLDCHRNPENFLRPVEQVTNLAWTADDHPEVVIDGKPKKLTQKELGEMLLSQWQVAPPESCGACHR